MEAGGPCFEDAEIQIAFQVLKFPEGFGFGDVQVIAREDAEAPTAPQEVAQVLPDEAHSAPEDERDREIGAKRPVEVAAEVGEQRIGITPDERTCVGREADEVEPWGRTGQVIRPMRNDAADPAPRIGNVAVVPRDDVEVKVEDGLPGSLADVDADVETVRLVLPEDLLPHPINRSENRRLFLAGGIEPGRDMPPRHDQRMTGRDRKSIPKRDHEGIFVEDPIPRRLAEWAGEVHFDLGSPTRFRLVLVITPLKPASTQARHRIRESRRRL